VAHRPGHNVAGQTDALGSWVWSQRWLDVLFLHWPVPAARLRPHVPFPLEIDAYDGDAWVSLVLFRLHVRPRWLPFVPWLSSLLEVNLRTYVRFQDRAGLWLLGAHADNRWAIRLARCLTPMPYTHAAMRYRRCGAEFRFRAWHGPAPDSESAFTFRPTGPRGEPQEHSLDEYLLERYRLFAPGGGSALVQAEVAHPRWVAQGARVCISANRFGRPCGLDLSSEPERAHFSPGVRARFGAFRRLETAEGGRRHPQLPWTQSRYGLHKA
jgi:uncharacterized protein